MNGTAAISIGFAGLVSACAQPNLGATPGGGAMRGLSVVHEGATYFADIGPGTPGEVLTADGAKAVAGMTVTVQGTAAPLGYDQGRRAKAVARAACVGQGRDFNASALGHLAKDTWTFRGACI